MRLQEKRNNNSTQHSIESISQKRSEKKERRQNTTKNINKTWNKHDEKERHQTDGNEHEESNKTENEEEEMNICKKNNEINAKTNIPDTRLIRLNLTIFCTHKKPNRERESS